MWNWCIRLVLEASLELAFTCTLSLQYGNFAGGSFWDKFNYIFAALLTFFLVLLAPFIWCFYGRNVDKLNDEEFEERWGAPYEGLYSFDKYCLLYSIFFVLRRVTFAAISILMPGFLPG